MLSDLLFYLSRLLISSGVFSSSGGPKAELAEPDAANRLSFTSTASAVRPRHSYGPVLAGSRPRSRDYESGFAFPRMFMAVYSLAKPHGLPGSSNVSNNLLDLRCDRYSVYGVGALTAGSLGRDWEDHVLPGRMLTARPRCELLALVRGRGTRPGVNRLAEAGEPAATDKGVKWRWAKCSGLSAYLSLAP